MRRLVPVLCLASLSAACRDASEAVSETPTTPRGFAAPGPCELFANPQPVCDYEALPSGEPGSGSGGGGGLGQPWGGAGGIGAAEGSGGAASDGEDGSAELDPTAQCLVSEDVILRCPSPVGMWSMARGAEDELDVAVALLGTDAMDERAVLQPNTQAYVQTLRHLPGAATELAFDVLEPRPAATLSFALLPASGSSDTLLVSRFQPGESPPGSMTIQSVSGGETVATFDVATPLLARPSAFVGASGLGTFSEFSAFSGLFVTTGLPGAPRSITLTDYAGAYALDENSAGELRAVTQDGALLRLLGGAHLDQVLWSTEVRAGSNMPRVDLVHVTKEGVGELAVVLTSIGDADPYRVHMVAPDGTSSPPVFFGHTSNDCSFSIGIVCDECPVGRQCRTRRDLIWGARLLVSGGRVFVVYVATDHTEHQEVQRNITSIGLGCTCNTKEVSTEETGDHLVVAEVEPMPDAAMPPRLTTRMRRPIADPRQAQAALFARGPRGTLDLAFGPPLARFADGQRSFPREPVSYRVLRVDPVGARPSGD